MVLEKINLPNDIKNLNFDELNTLSDEMRELIELGCDAIMTDNPILLKQVLAEYK